MNSITIKNIRYNFEEKTYRINNNMSFKINLVRFEEDSKVIVLTLLKSLVIKFNDKEETFKEFDKKLKIKDYLQNIENVQLINNISLDINNKVYYNFITNSDAVHTASETTNIIKER